MTSVAVGALLSGCSQQAATRAPQHRVLAAGGEPEALAVRQCLKAYGAYPVGKPSDVRWASRDAQADRLLVRRLAAPGASTYVLAPSRRRTTYRVYLLWRGWLERPTPPPRGETLQRGFYPPPPAVAGPYYRRAAEKTQPPDIPPPTPRLHRYRVPARPPPP